MSGFRVRFFKKVLGGNGHEVDACQYSFETLANTRAEAEERAKKAFCEDHHLMNWTIHADRCQVQQADFRRGLFGRHRSHRLGIGASRAAACQGRGRADGLDASGLTPGLGASGVGSLSSAPLAS